MQGLDNGGSSVREQGSELSVFDEPCAEMDPFLKDRERR
jgi:hypothetical protein